MPFKPIKILGKRYLIVPSLANMCALEEETNTNLILGISPAQINLRMMQAVIANIIEDEDGHHITDTVLDELYQKDVGYAQKIFEQAISQMYSLPKPDNSMSASKNQKSLCRRIFAILRRRG